MPTYEYKCFACNHTFEQFQSITAAPVKRCPQCGKAKVRRLLGTGAGLIFKGSGFYITDYRSEGYKNAAKADTGGKPSGESGPADPKAAAKTEGASKTESKAESKAEPKASSPQSTEGKSPRKKQ